jgi:hypothetical protein
MFIQQNKYAFFFSDFEKVYGFAIADSITNTITSDFDTTRQNVSQRSLTITKTTSIQHESL